MLPTFSLSFYSWFSHFSSFLFEIFPLLSQSLFFPCPFPSVPIPFLSLLFLSMFLFHTIFTDVTKKCDCDWLWFNAFSASWAIYTARIGFTQKTQKGELVQGHYKIILNDTFGQKRLHWQVNKKICPQSTATKHIWRFYWRPGLVVKVWKMLFGFIWSVSINSRECGCRGRAWKCRRSIRLLPLDALSWNSTECHQKYKKNPNFGFNLLDFNYR